MDFNPFSTNEVNGPELLNSIGGGGGGFGSGLMNLLGNKMFIQMLSAAGNDMMRGTGGTGLNSAIQGNISAQNYAKSFPMLAKMASMMLGGKMIPGGSLKINDKGVDMHLDHLNSSGADTSAGSNSGNIGGSKLANPFVGGQSSGEPMFGEEVLPGINSSDLAGLTPQEISSAFTFGMNAKKMQEQRINDLINNAYKIALMKQVGQQTANATPQFPVTLPDGTEMKLTQSQLLQWQQLKESEKTALMKNFEYAKSKGYKGSIVDYANTAKTNNQKDYEYYVAGEKAKKRTPKPFYDWLLGKTKAGATRISLGEKLKETEEKGKLKPQLWATSTKMVDDVNKYLDSSQGYQDLAAVLEKNPNDKWAKQKVAAQYIEKKLISGGVKIKGLDWNSKTHIGTWHVIWPSGKEGTVTYDFSK